MSFLPDLQFSLQFSNSCNNCYCIPRFIGCCKSDSIHEEVYDPSKDFDQIGPSPRSLMIDTALDAFPHIQGLPSVRDCQTLRNRQRIIYGRKNNFKAKNAWKSRFKHEEENRLAYQKLKKELSECYCQEVADIAWKIAKIKHDIHLQDLEERGKALTWKSYKDLHVLSWDLCTILETAQQLFEKIHQINESEKENYMDIFNPYERKILERKYDSDKLFSLKRHAKLLELEAGHLSDLLDSCYMIKQETPSSRQMKGFQFFASTGIMSEENATVKSRRKSLCMQRRKSAFYVDGRRASQELGKKGPEAYEKYLELYKVMLKQKKSFS